MKRNITRELTLSGLFIALGLVLPMLFHMIGAGNVFLPMHIPVLIAGFCLSLPFAAAVGIITPILSTLLTGMPMLFPVLPYMAFELLTYAVAANILYRKFKLNSYISLMISMAAGRMVSSLVVWILASFFTAKLPSPLIFLSGTVMHGIPGIILQILIIPPVIIVLNRYHLIRREAVTE